MIERYNQAYQQGGECYSCLLIFSVLRKWFNRQIRVIICVWVSQLRIFCYLRISFEVRLVAEDFDQLAIYGQWWLPYIGWVHQINVATAFLNADSEEKLKYSCTEGYKMPAGLGCSFRRRYVTWSRSLKLESYHVFLRLFLLIRSWSLIQCFSLLLICHQRSARKDYFGCLGLR